jgi:cobalt-zinc-cadmium efflux system membrane fusion protein
MKKIIIIAVLGIFTACSENETATEQTQQIEQTETEVDLTSEQLAVNNYTIGKPTVHPFSETVSVTGLVDLPPSHRHVISNYVAGYIKTIKVIPGDPVRKGQVLAVIEHQGILELQERYIKAESEREYLEQEYTRLSKLFEENVVAKSDFIAAKSKFLSIEAQANSLKQQLQLINLSPKNVRTGNISSSYVVRAPANGIISKINASTGEWVGNDKQLMTMVDPDHIHLELEVFAKDIHKIKEGQSIAFGLHGEGSHPHVAHIHRIGAEVMEDRRVLVHAHPDSSLENLTIGAYVDGEIMLNSDSLLALPSTAITSLDDQSFVLMVIDSADGTTHFRQTPIKIIKRSGDWIAIDQKWAGEAFLLNGTFDLIKEEEGGGHSH